MPTKLETRAISINITAISIWSTCNTEERPNHRHVCIRHSSGIGIIIVST